MLGGAPGLLIRGHPVCRDSKVRARESVLSWGPSTTNASGVSEPWPLTAGMTRDRGGARAGLVTLLWALVGPGSGRHTDAGQRGPGRDPAPTSLSSSGHWSRVPGRGPGSRGRVLGAEGEVRGPSMLRRPWGGG